MRTLALIAMVGCSSGYMPQRPGQVAVMLEDGQVTYVRDGKKHSHGFLGGGLEDAVHGNPNAMRAASEYTDRLRTGFIGVVVGALASIGGMVYTLREIGDGGTTDNNEDAARNGALIMLGGMVIMLAGTGYAASAEPYRWDAINIFNDQSPMMPTPAAPAWRPPQASLKMRD